MGFVQELDANSKKLFTVYDFAAFCYDYLIKNVGDQARFLGKYIMENESAEYVNPNLQKLRNLNNEIGNILRKREELGIPFSECIGESRMYLDHFKLEKYGEALLNEATIPFFILLSIDRYVKKKSGRHSDTAPLNKEYCKDSYIYLNPGKSILDDAAERNNFSDIIHSALIRNQVENLIILEKRELPDNVEPPRTVQLWIDDTNEEKLKAIAEKKLKIATIPFGEEEMLVFPVKEGALFHVKYKKKHLKTGSERAEKLLEFAVEKRANIIIFPEFVCGQKIQDTIQKWLKDTYEKTPEKMSSLLFVIAGSGWTEDENNVSYIYSYNGRLIGKQYKNCRYSDLKRKGKELIENLQNPGKETTIVDVKGLGKVLVGICRDVSEYSYTELLAKVFRPQFLLVPAWSKSVNIGFKNQFQEIVEKNHRTCSILCNCCEAFHNLDKFKTEIGLAVTPYKNGTVIEGTVNKISRGTKCIQKCKIGGCVFILDMDFGYEPVKKGKIVSNCQQEFVS